MTTARAYVAAAITDAVPGDWTIVPVGRELDAITAPTVVIYRETVTNATPPTRSNTLAVWVLSPIEAPTRVEDPLDADLDLVLAILDALPGVVWTTAERGAYLGTAHGWRITATLTTTEGD